MNASETEVSAWRAVKDRTPFSEGLWVVETVRGAHVTDYVTSEAAARLIAAAPDLLAALRDLVDTVVELNLPDTYDEALAASRAAIAKAEGR